VICQFQRWKGVQHIPNVVHPALRWTPQDPMYELPVVTDTAWQMIVKSKLHEGGMKFRQTMQTVTEKKLLTECLCLHKEAHPL